MRNETENGKNKENITQDHKTAQELLEIFNNLCPGGNIPTNVCEIIYQRESKNPGYAEMALAAIRQAGLILDDDYTAWCAKYDSGGRPLDDVRPLLEYSIFYDKSGNEKSRKIVQSVKNWETVLEYDKRFAGKIGYDDFTRQIFLRGSVPWDDERCFRLWGNVDDSQSFSLIQSDYGLQRRQDYFDSVLNVAIKNRFHQVKDVLSSLPAWDGKPHIEKLLPDFLGAERSEYTAAVMRTWMIAAVARIFSPGCKFDNVLTLEGRQGIGKSTFFRLLSLDDEWYSDSLGDLDKDRAAEGIVGIWICELAELRSMIRTSNEGLKRFLSATSDRMRMPYARRSETFPRQTVFGATTNEISFLPDQSGNRRFWIIHCGISEPTRSLFEAAAMDEIRLAWSEALHIWRNEKPPLMLPERFRNEAEEFQQAALFDDGTNGLILKYLKGRDRVCAIEIWQEALGELGRPPRSKSGEINQFVASLPEWERMKSPATFSQYGSQRGFRKRENVVKGKDGFAPLTEEYQEVLPFEN